MIAFPSQVFLRNGQAAVIQGLVPIGRPDAEQAMIAGVHGAAGTKDLWLDNGRWSYREDAHPLDIVSLVLTSGKHVEFNKEVLA